MNEATLRAWWSHRQGLDGSMQGQSAASVLNKAGWARSVAGINPYLTLYSRAGIGRQAVDDAVAASEISELPSARGCTYVVPASDFALALKLSQPSGDAEMNTARKLGVTEAEVAKLEAAVVKALSKAVLEPDAIREAVGPAARNLGDEGKKKGMITTLPLALGRLQSKGEIRRVPVTGRLDQQRYKYTAWNPNPLAKFKLTYEEACVELAKRYFEWIAPATMAEFQWFSGLGVKTAKAAVEPLKLVPLESGSDRLISPGALDKLKVFSPPKKPQYSLVSSLDAISLLRRDLKMLVAAEDQASPLFDVKEARSGSGLMDLPNHAILDRGRLVGLWEFDPASNAIAWATFIKPDAVMKKAVADTEAVVRDQYGDARSFSLDSPKSRVPKIEALLRFVNPGK